MVMAWLILRASAETFLIKVLATVDRNDSNGHTDVQLLVPVCSYNTGWGAGVRMLFEVKETNGLI